jgi:uncharacterized lipoprotein
MAFGPITAHMEELAMKSIARMAALVAALALVSGCSHSMRHNNQQLKDQVKLPSAPVIEPSTSAPAGYGVTSPAPLTRSAPSSSLPTGPN